MSDSTIAPAVQPPSPSGITENKPNNIEALEKKNAELLAELKAAKGKVKDFESVEKSRQEEEAKKRGDFEAILKSREEELQQTKAKLAEKESHIVNAKKLAAIMEAAKTDIDRKWFDIIDTDSIVINPTTDEVDSMSVTKTVEALRKNWPEMFKVPGSSGLPSDAPKGNMGGKIARADWLKLDHKEMVKYKPGDILD